MPYGVEFYKTASGRCDITEFLDGLSERHRNKCLASTAKLMEQGPERRRPQEDHVRGEIRELRPSVGRVRYRMLYAKTLLNSYVILNVDKKKQEKIPENQIRQAEERLAEGKRRHGST